MAEKTAIVVGSGISGLNTAFSLVEKGYRVKVIEKKPYIGGKLRQLDWQFPNDACGMCQMYPLYDPSFCDTCIRRGVEQKDIEFLTLTEIVDIEGEKGSFRVKVLKKHRGVNDNCTACGECEKVCPEYRFSDFNYTKTKAIYRDYPRNFPNLYTIDFNACTKCGKCVQVCPENAIELDGEDEEVVIEADYVFWAPGIKERDLSYLKEFGYGLYENVIHSTHFERLISGNHPHMGELKRPSDGKRPKKIAFIQCMGSRDRQNPDCSSICCMFALKEARLLKEYHRDIEPWIFYMDMRAYTKWGYRYFKATDAHFVNARPAKIEEDENKNLILYFEENGKFKKEVFDLVVLSVGTEVEIPKFENKDGIYLVYDSPLEIRKSILSSYAATLSVEYIEKSREEFSFPLKDEYKIAIVDTTGKLPEFSGMEVLEVPPLRKEEHVATLLGKLAENSIDLFVLIVDDMFMAERVIAGRINPLTYEIVDITRENDIRFATERAYLKLKYRVPVRGMAQKPQKEVLVIGAGPAGLTAAVELAGHGIRVHVVEKEESPGGEGIHVKRTLDGKKETLIENLLKEASDLRIPIYTGSTVKSIRGIPGDYVVEIERQDGREVLNVSSVVLATGASAYTPSEYMYGKNEKVMTQREFEESDVDIQKLSKVVMIQCVGSRNDEYPVCSVVCCRDAIKNAIYIKENNPKADVYVLYRDMMTYGTKERYYTEARRKGVIFIRFSEENPPRVYEEDGNIRVEVHDKTFDMDLAIQPDLLILSTGMRPREVNAYLAEMLNIDLDEDGYFNTLNIKYNPVQARNAGVFIAGTALSPMSMDEAVLSAKAAASKVIDFLNNFGVSQRYRTSAVRERVCAGCALCVEVCPFEARFIEEDEKVAKVIYDICQACGLCVAACPSGSAFLLGEETKGIMQTLSRI